jgi:hypothetical protein
MPGNLSHCVGSDYAIFCRTGGAPWPPPAAAASSGGLAIPPMVAPPCSSTKVATAAAPAGTYHCNIIEAPWLVNGGHGASLNRHAAPAGTWGIIRDDMAMIATLLRRRGWSMAGTAHHSTGITKAAGTSHSDGWPNSAASAASSAARA